MSSRIFVSYSHEDWEIVERSLQRLRDWGHTAVFVDRDPERGIAAGAEWNTTLYQRIASARVMLAICRTNSRMSCWCLAETAIAQSHGIRIIPVIIDGSAPQSHVALLQVVDCPSGDLDGLRRALESVRVRPGEDAIWNPNRPPFPGLLRLEREDAPQRHWLVLPPLERYRDPVKDLIKAVNAAVKLPAPELPHVAELDEQRLANLLDQALLADHRPPGARMVLVLDQAEGLISETVVGRERFLQLLDALCADEDSPVFLIVVIRSDAFPRLAELLNLGPERAHNIGLSALDTAALKRIVEGPARAAGIPIDDGLADRMAADTGGSDSLPLLAYTLRAMWDSSTNRRLTTAQYEQLGGISGAIRNQLTFLDKVATEEREALRQAFGGLVSATESDGFARRVAAWAELPHQAHRVLERLVDR